MAEIEKIETEVVEEEVTDTAPATKKGSEKPVEKKPGFFKRSLERIKKFWKSYKSELKKIVWPGAKTVTKNTWVVLVCIVIVGILLWVFDYLAGQGASGLIHLFNK